MANYKSQRRVGSEQNVDARPEVPTIRSVRHEHGVVRISGGVNRLEATSKPAGMLARYRVIGMDCAKDAAEIERAVRKVPGVRTARVSVASQTLTFDAQDAPMQRAGIEQAVSALGYRLDPLDAGGEAGNPAHITLAYKRALWIVVILNLAYGVAEMVGGFLSGSQALRADALDFLGDGSITLLGLIAIGWSLRWRARSALIQGVFLAALGLGVLVSTGYRAIVQVQPEADVMGMFGVMALAVNVAAAIVLIPHRTGDANMRAVWLFSRNDAIGNVAIVAAAFLVAWTDAPWPDLVVSAAIAALFLHSAWMIIRDARTDLAQA